MLFRSTRRRAMVDSAGGETPQDVKVVERVPVMQRVLDNHFLLVFIGVTVPTVFYVIWGLIEITLMPIAK